MQSIIYQGDKCALCGRIATDTHHIFYGAGLRTVSEQYGLTIRLCRACHTDAGDSVHKNRITDLALKRYAQRKAMELYGWNTDEFRSKFRKNYL